MKKNSLTRFSNTVANYVRYRPDYPFTLVPYLMERLDLQESSVVADIGSGTGKSTLPFLKNNNPVFAVEPNAPMRTAAEKLLATFPNFKSINGSAEATTLADNSVDLILAGQAFHWFDIPRARTEFMRIARPDAGLCLLWNKRDDTASEFMRAYNEFLHIYATDYTKVNLRYICAADYQLIFGHARWHTQTFPNYQIFDWSGLLGRYLSCSYAYHRDHPDHERATEALRSIFVQHEVNGKVKMDYTTELHYGKLA